MDNKKQKLVIITGSPHPNGNIATAVNTICAGTAQAVEIKKFELPKLKIQNCCGCRKCVDNGGVCILKDDMADVFKEVISADIVLIASPIYICQVNGYTKTFLDRLYPLTDARHKPRFGTRKLIMLYTYGAPVPFLFRRYMKQTGKDLKAMGLNLYKTIILSGCTALDKTKENKKRIDSLYKIGNVISHLN